MKNKAQKGFALLLLGIILSVGAILEIVYFWYAGLLLGIIGTTLVFSKDNSKE